MRTKSPFIYIKERTHQTTESVNEMAGTMSVHENLRKDKK
jgi:hypothetical protein